jgi:thiamine-phosphate pyrophosphorylase
MRFVTVAAHSAEAVTRAAALGVDACLLAPVFPTRSASGRQPLGLFRASQIARGAAIPVIALGGINADTARRLTGRGFAGLAAVDALVA